MLMTMCTMDIGKTERDMEEVIFLTIIYTVIGIMRYPDGASKEGDWRDGLGNGNMVYT